MPNHLARLQSRRFGFAMHNAARATRSATVKAARPSIHCRTRQARCPPRLSPLQTRNPEASAPSIYQLSSRYRYPRLGACGNHQPAERENSNRFVHTTKYDRFATSVRKRLPAGRVFYQPEASDPKMYTYCILLSNTEMPLGRLWEGGGAHRGYGEVSDGGVGPRMHGLDAEKRTKAEQIYLLERGLCGGLPLLK